MVEDNHDNPYEVPGAPLEDQHPVAKFADLKDPTSLTKWTLWFLYAQVVVGAVAIISGLLEYQLLSEFQNGVYTSEDAAVAAGEASELREGIVDVLQFIVLVVSGFLILRWIHRANFNARQLGASAMRYTPGWSIGWYFVPIVNLWKPYQAMKEIWQASTDPQKWREQSVSSLLPWWWFLWIVSNVLENVSFEVTMSANEINEFLTANFVTQLSDATSIPLCLLLIAIVKQIYALQTVQAAARHTDAP